MRSLAALVGGIAAICMHGTAVAVEVQTVDRASMVAWVDGEQTARPPTEISLPFRWDKRFPGKGGRFIATVKIEPSQGVESVFLERAGNRMAIYGDDRLLYRSPETTLADLDDSKQARLLELASPIRQLRIESKVQPLHGAELSQIVLGPRVAISELHARHRLVQEVLPAAYASALLLMGLLAAGLWWRQHDRIYGTFSLIALFGSLRYLDKVWLQVPIPWSVWGPTLAVAYGLHLALVARFATLAASAMPRWLDLLQRGCLVLVAVLAVMSFILSERSLWTAGLIVLASLGVVCFACVARQTSKRPEWISVSVLVVGGLMTIAGVHDIVLVRGNWMHTELPVEPWTPHALAGIVLLLAVLIVHRYSTSVTDLQSLNATLEERVAERDVQLKAAYASLQAQHEEQAALGERQRIMRDIHDGVGSHLIDLLGQSRQPGVVPSAMEQGIVEALDELRMAVDALQPVNGALSTVLATMRYRLQPRLRTAGIDVVWNVPPLPAAVGLTPHVVLEIQRILMEAFTNLVRHADATTVWVGAMAVEQRLPAIRIWIRDNGRAFMTDAIVSGHGLANMKFRAQAIGAGLVVLSVPGEGTEVSLTWSEVAADADQRVQSTAPPGISAAQGSMSLQPRDC